MAFLRKTALDQSDHPSLSGPRVESQVPKDKDEVKSLQERLQKRYLVDAFNLPKKEFDPNQILSNNILDKLLPLTEFVA